MQDAAQIKEKVISTLRQRGPSLPIHVASATGQSMLFSSAFLSELYADKRLKISNMKVGGSPLYFLPEHENQLENFSRHLGSKEREAFDLLKEKKFLKDSELHPAIRVALRSIKDFAIPMTENNELYWKYFTVDPSEFVSKLTKVIPQEKKEEVLVVQKLHASPDENLDSKKDKEILKEEFKEKVHEPKIVQRIKTTKTKAKKKVTKQDDKFFNRVKDYLTSKSIEILGIEGITKNDLTLKIRLNEKELIIVAYNKKKIDESDIIKAHKKSQEYGLAYGILSLGEPSKKLTGLIDSVKDLHSIGKIE